MSPRIYPAQELAFRRVETLKIRFGLWPGVRRCEGGWELSYDPERDTDTSGDPR